MPRRNPGALSLLPRNLAMMVDSGDAAGTSSFPDTGGTATFATPASAALSTSFLMPPTSSVASTSTLDQVIIL